ncbi:PH domain-containing protein [Halobaculum sp. MBLA0143]|uniref:PH domain-containing protein n=1 Tax=Halobaculum sp. MBLA0143 TaxID=3079933 RepID=UPI003523D7F6
METLHPRVRLVWVASTLVSAGLLAGFGFVGDRLGVELPVGPSPLVLFGAVATLVGLLGIVFAVLRYRVWGYEIRDDSLYLVRGVLTRRVSSVPFVRVQHVDTRRGPVERAVGLASVVVYTAGSRGADITVPGLTPDRATQLRERLRELAAESEYDAV